MYLRKATFAITFLVSSYFVVLTAYDSYASTFSTTSGPIERTLGGVQGFFTNPSSYDSACGDWDGTPCLACLGVACSWSRAGPVVTQSSLGNPLSTRARTPYTTQLV